ncbi:MAG: TRAP transporter small permease [Deltaproteobacteria bacterium]|nr:TRAP transporter small permease [Deltaproteobacteria bacterium]
MRCILEKINRALIQSETAICAFLMAGVALATLWGVFERFVLRIGLGISDELARYINVYCIFFGACLGVVKSSHVGVDVFVRILPARMHKIMGIISYAICAVFCAIISCTGFSYFMRLYLSNQLTPSLQIPICFVFLAVPVGCLLMGIHFVLRIALDDIDTPASIAAAATPEEVRYDD